MTYEWHRAEIPVDEPVNPVRVVDDLAVRCLTEYLGLCRRERLQALAVRDRAIRHRRLCFGKRRLDGFGTTRVPKWTGEFSNRLAVEPGARPTQEQTTLYYRQREYLLPTMNRGQVVRLAYPNAVRTEHQPTL